MKEALEEIAHQLTRWFDSIPKRYDSHCPACFPLAITFPKEVSQAPHSWMVHMGRPTVIGCHGGDVYEACRALSADRRI